MPEIAECYSIAKQMPKVGKIQQISWSSRFKSHIDKKHTFTDLKGFSLGKPFGYGKSIWIPLSNKKQKGFIISQLGMSGGWFLEEKERNIHLKILGEKNMFYHDPRMFGKMNLFLFDIKEKGIQEKVLQNFNWGVEPIKNPEKVLDQLISKTKSSRKIKELLLDQSLIFGVGNYLASEILFEARINPFIPANTLTSKQILKLEKASLKVINKALESEGFSFAGGYELPDGSGGKMTEKVKVYSREGKKCTTKGCSSLIKSDYINNRITYFCPNCQKK